MIERVATSIGSALLLLAAVYLVYHGAFALGEASTAT